MASTAYILTLIELGIGGIGAIGGVLTWRYRHRTGGIPLILLFIGGTGYALASGLNDLLSAELVVHLVHNLTYPFGTLVAVASVLLALEVTNRARYRHNPVVLLGSILVFADLLLAMTDPIHNLYIAERIFTETGIFVREAANTGDLFWIRSILNFGIGFLATGFIVAELLRSKGKFRMHLTTITLAYVIAITFFAWQTFFPIHPAFDVATVGMLGASLLILWALFFGNFLQAIPIARATLMAEMEDPVIAVDSEHRVVDLNSAAQSLLDLETVPLAAPAREVFANVPELITHIEQGTETRLQLETTAHGPRQYSVRTSDITNGADATAEPLGRLIVLRDISERVERERRLERERNRLEQFANIVSHDLRNPLNVAAIRLDLAREEYNSEHLESVATAHQRMEAIIDDVLSLAQAGESVGELETVSLEDIVVACWANVETKDSELVVESERLLTADESRLKQLLENLIRNAVEHGGDDVSVTVGALDGGFYVEDDGPGIPDDERDSVFEAGYSTVEQGTGLGLNIVREIAEAHGWSVRVTEGEDGGARFEITGVEDGE